MFGYYLELAVRSLKRSRGLTVLMVFAIGFGVAASMTTYSVFRAVSGDPIPWKSSRLFVPQIDAWGPRKGREVADLQQALTYTDAMALMRDHRAKLQSPLYMIAPAIMPTRAGEHPVNVTGHAVSSEFFPMVEAPFAHGAGWTTDDDRRRAAVAVISERLNRKLFAGQDSVGRTIRIAGKDYRVVGVLGDWNPQPRYYDIYNSNGFSTDRDDIFIPFDRAIESAVTRDGSNSCYVVPKDTGFEGLKKSSCVWVPYMLQLDDAAAVASFRRYLHDYAGEQQRAGRFNWAPNVRLSDIPTFLVSEEVAPRDTKISLIVAIGLLVVCLVNTVGLLLAKFLRRSGEIGIRRALGAPRTAIYAQFLTEAGIVGLAGGVLGLVLTGLGVLAMGWLLPRHIAALARLDMPLLLLTLAVAIASTILAALYPTLRASQVQPAWQLKSN